MSKNDSFILIVLISFFSCKNENSTNRDMFSKKDTAGINSKLVEPSNAVRSDTPIRSMFADPVAIANNKYSRYDTILLHDISTQFWQFDMGIEGNKSLTSNDLDGLWLKFNENGTYEKGTFNKSTDKGNFTIDNFGTIEMTPNNKADKKSEWSSKLNNDLMIMVGTAKYNDGHMQLRLSRTPQKPVKPK